MKSCFMNNYEHITEYVTNILENSYLLEIYFKF